MPSRSLVRAFLGLWWTLGAVLLFLSARTLWRALPHAPHVMLLAGVEAVAALLFLFPRSLRVGAGLLLLTFAVAFFVHVAQGQLPAELLIYTAAVLFVAVHGPVPAA